MNNNNWYSGPPVVPSRPNAQGWYLELQRVKREYKVLSDKSEKDVKTFQSELADANKMIQEQKQSLDSLTAQLVIAIKTIELKDEALKDITGELQDKTAEIEKLQSEVKEAEKVSEKIVLSENEFEDDLQIANHDYEEDLPNLPISSNEEVACKELKVRVYNDPTIAALYMEQQAEYRNIENDEGLFTCNQCKKSFEELKYFKKHLLGAHGKKSKLKCSYCEKKFKKLKIKEFHEKEHCSERRRKRKVKKSSVTQFEWVPTLRGKFKIPKKLSELEMTHVKSIIATHSKLEGIAPSKIEEVFVKDMGSELSCKWIEELEQCNFIETKIFLKE